MLFNNKLSRKEGQTLINKISTNQNNKTKKDTNDKRKCYHIPCVVK